MAYRVTEDGELVVGLGMLRTKVLVDLENLVLALERLSVAARHHVVHEDDYPDGPQAPSTARFGELYPAGLSEEDWGVEYPAHPVRLECPEGAPGSLDWGLVRIEWANYSLDDRMTASVILVECLAREIDPDDMVEALTSAAAQIERYARRRGGVATC